MAKIMRSRAEVGFLGDGRAFVNLNLVQAVGVSAVTEAGVVMHDEIPRQRDACSLVNEGFAM